MKPISHPLKLHDQGREVVNLLEALLLLIEKEVIRIPQRERPALLEKLASERREGSYSDAATRAVSLFQNQHQIKPTGGVDEQTAEAMNKHLRELGAIV